MYTLLDEILSNNSIEDFYEINVDLLKGKYDDHTDSEIPSIAGRCGGQGVRTALHVATTYTSLASQRLNYLSSLPENQKGKTWNNGPEKTWFGQYRKNRLINIRNRMRKIVKTLQSPMLVIQCNWKKETYGKAFPGNPTITLGSYWKDSPGSHVNKVQTLIHEAAHIRSAILGGEPIKKFYGIKAAIKRAKKHPSFAIRTAENIGYYATCRSGSYKKFEEGGCP
jgi:hypothetical protein